MRIISRVAARPVDGRWEPVCGSVRIRPAGTWATKKLALAAAREAGTLAILECVRVGHIPMPTAIEFVTSRSLLLEREYFPTTVNVHQDEMLLAPIVATLPNGDRLELPIGTVLRLESNEAIKEPIRKKVKR